MGGMSREEVIRCLADHRAEIQRFGVRSLDLFGSMARGQAGSNSDVDLLVEFDGPTTFQGFMGLKLTLEDLLGRPVDLVTRRALKPRLYRNIHQDLIHVA